MTFLAPAFLLAAGLAALVVAGLHFLSTRDPKLEPFPTTRFLPDVPLRATATKLRPTDPWLLLLRVVLVLLAGAALARPVLTPPRRSVARIVAVDVSRAVGEPAELADSAGAYLPAATVILFDSAAAEAPQAAVDSLRMLAGESRRDGAVSVRALAGRSPGGAASRGSLSAAFLAARRAAARMRDRADSLELVVVSPFAAEEYDAATETIRGLWPGRVTLVAVAAAQTDERRDSIRVEWADSVDSAHWTVRSTPDTVAAVRAGDAVLVYPFVRRWRLAAPDGAVRILARWADGEPAAIERPHGRAVGGGSPRPAAAGCVRSFGFALPTEGDALLRPAFQRFLENLAAPCGEPRDFSPLPANVMASLAGEGRLAASAAIERRVERVTPLTPWLLLAAALLAVLELVARGRGGREAASTAADHGRGRRSKGRAA